MRSLKENLLRNVGVGQTQLIKDWLSKNTKITGSYSINDDLTINASGTIRLKNYAIKEFPEYIQFNEVDGYFDCGDSYLTTLRGCPKICVSFSAANSDIKTLDGGPQIVKGNYTCYDCSQLQSLKGAPEEVGGDFCCNFCHNLSSLEYSPKKVGLGFSCVNNKSLTSLKGAPKEAGSFECSGCGVKFTKDDVRKVCNVKKYITT